MLMTSTPLSVWNVVAVTYSSAAAWIVHRSLLPYMPVDEPGPSVTHVPSDERLQY